MTNTLRKLPRLTYVPAVPGVLAVPAYCTTVASEQSYSGSAVGPYSGSAPIQPSASAGFAAFGLDSEGNKIGGISQSQHYQLNNSAGGANGYSPYSPAKIFVHQCFPAVAGRAGSPASTKSTDAFGWNSGGRSAKQVPETGSFSGLIPLSPIGVQLGFVGESPGYYYSEMAHSMVVRYGDLTVVERGITVAGPFAVAGGTMLKIQRERGKVSYWVGGEKVYTSAAGSAGKIFGGAVLYSSNDYIDAPEITLVAESFSFGAVIPSIVMAAGQTGHKEVRTKIPLLQLTATLSEVEGYATFSAPLNSLVLAASESAAARWVRGAMPALTLRAELVNAEVIPSNMVGITAPFTLSTDLLSGGSISFSADLRVLLAVSETLELMTLDAILPISLSVGCDEAYLPADTADGSDAAVLGDWGSLESALLLVAIDTLEVGGSASLVMVLELAGMDGLSIGEHASFGSIVTLLAMEQVAIMSHASSARQQALQYAVNYMTGALTTYQDFDFAGFTHSTGRAFAWNASGLYRLGAERDNGEVIGALVDFGATDYGDSHIKRAETAFVGVRTDGACYLRLAADDEVERIYSLIGGGNQKRAQLAKGVSSRYWNVRLELADASFATLDSVELEVGVTQRRSFNRSI